MSLENCVVAQFPLAVLMKLLSKRFNIGFLFPNLITSSVVDLRVDCKGRAGLSASGFCGHRCHTDIGIRQQNADEGVPEHMRMDFFD